MDFEVRDPGELLSVIDCIHDQWFELEYVLGQIGTQRSMRFARDSIGLSNNVTQGHVVTMTILNVMGVVVIDTEHIGFYDVNILEYEPPLLRVITGVPLKLSFMVSSFHLILENCQ